MAALNGMELYHYVLMRWLALYRMLVWRWLPYMGCWSGDGCFKWHGIVLCASEEVAGLIMDAGMAVAALYGMLVWRWLPYMG